jgi:hypothetical protein
MALRANVHMDDAIAVATDTADARSGSGGGDHSSIRDTWDPDIGGEAMTVHRPTSAA